MLSGSCIKLLTKLILASEVNTMLRESEVSCNFLIDDDQEGEGINGSGFIVLKNTVNQFTNTQISEIDLFIYILVASSIFYFILILLIIIVLIKQDMLHDITMDGKTEIWKCEKFLTDNDNSDKIIFQQSSTNKSRREYFKSLLEKEEKLRLEINWNGRPDSSFKLWEYVKDQYLELD